MTGAFQPKVFASDLLRAHDYRTAIAPLSEVHPAATVEEAYIVQVHVMADMISRNDPVIGAKVGVHDRRPVFCLYPRSSLMGTFEVADLSQTIQAVAQPVLVLRLFKELSGTGISEHQVIDATETVVAGIEVIDFRMGPRDQLTHVDAIADNGGISRILIGEHGVDLTQDADVMKSLNCQFCIDGTESGPPADAITSPIAAVAALANHLGAQGGKLESDWFVVVGPLRAPVPLRVGSKVELNVDGMATVRLRAR